MINFKIAFLVFAVTAAHGAGQLQAAEVTKKIPAKFSLVGMNGGSLSQANFKTDVYVIQFWASWCTSCGMTMKEIGKWASAKKGARYVQVSVDESMDEARDYFKGRNAGLEGFKKTVFLDPEGRFAAKVGVTSIPTIMLIAKDGRVLKTIVGHPSEADLKAFDQVIVQGRGQS